jgi:hypothetical protein
MKRINKFAILLKRLVILFAPVLLILFLYVTFLPDIWRRTNLIVFIFVGWVITAYIALPWLHRLLSRFYVPDHFIGRSRTADGILSDPVNMGLNGSKHDLIRAMEAAGWTVAEDITPISIWKVVRAVVFNKSYPSAPMSRAFLFGKRHAVGFEIQVNNSPRVRHHVRFWKTPRNWYLPGGYKVDWLGAATYDKSVGMSLFTMQFTHAIHANVDKERDFLITSLTEASQIAKTRRIDHFFPAYKTRNGFGHEYITDGSMVIAELKEK